MKRTKYSLRDILVILGIFFCTTATISAQEKETFVIVHGAWGGSWSFKQTARLLTEEGYDVYRPSLTGQGERHHLADPEIGLSTHILDVVNTILFEDLHDIILVGHSYGGMVITGVADSIPERIKQLIYLDAFAPNHGESVMSSRPIEQQGPEASSSDGFIKPVWVRDSDPYPRDVPQSLKTFTEAVSYHKPEALVLPSTYILTVDEGKEPHDDPFYYFAARAKDRRWNVIHMVADHNPQMTMPPTLATLLIQAITSPR